MLSVVLLDQWGKPISEYGALVTYHKRSHSVTCHPTHHHHHHNLYYEWMRPALTSASKLVLDLPIPDEWNGRLSWPRLPGNAPAGSWTRDLSITVSDTPIHHRAVQLTWVVYCNTERLITCSLTVANSSNRSNRERQGAISGVYNYCSRWPRRPKIVASIFFTENLT